VESGKLRDRITFEVLTMVDDPFGAPIPTWDTAFLDWGEYQGLGSREFPLSQKRNAETTARFIVRYRTGINAATSRIRFDGKVWNISEPIHDLKRSLLTIEASEIQ
jgi:SPP1 family predicted phage head-tail adaptor